MTKIVSHPNIMSGTPVVEGTRVPAETVLAEVHVKTDKAEIYESYPRLPADAIDACVNWEKAGRPFVLANIKGVTIEISTGKGFADFITFSERVENFKRDDSNSYIIVADYGLPKEIRILLYSRNKDLTWNFKELRGRNTIVELPDVGLSFPISRLYPPEETPPQEDFAILLENTFFKLKELDIAAKNKNIPAILDIVDQIDWTMVFEELEPVVYGTYKRAVYHHARRAIRNLLRPYMLYHHLVRLDMIRDMIEWHLRESPSLHETADQLVAEALEREIQKAELLQKHIRDLPAIETIVDLRRAINEKIAAGKALERVPGPYREGERVLYE